MAPQGKTLRVKGYREFLRASSRAEKAANKEVRAALARAAEPVREEAARLFDTVSPKSAAGYRVRVRQTAVSVEQKLRKTTGLHPEFGSLQMREALIPALERKEHEVLKETDRAIEEIAEIFEH